MIFPTQGPRNSLLHYTAPGAKVRGRIAAVTQRRSRTEGQGRLGEGGRRGGRWASHPQGAEIPALRTERPRRAHFSGAAARRLQDDLRRRTTTASVPARFTRFGSNRFQRFFGATSGRALRLPAYGRDGVRTSASPRCRSPTRPIRSWIHGPRRRQASSCAIPILDAEPLRGAAVRGRRSRGIKGERDREGERERERERER